MLAVCGAAAVLVVLAVPAVAGGMDLAKTAAQMVFVGLCRRVATSPQITSAARRFWHRATVSGLLFVVGSVLGVITGLERAVPTENVLASSVLIALGAAVLGWALLAYPLNVSGHARARLRLDVATVMCAFVMLAWYLALPGGSPSANTAKLGVAVLGSVMALVTAYAAVNVLISGTAPFTVEAGVILGAAVLIWGWAMFNMLSMSPADVRYLFAAQVAAAFLLAIAARVQVLQMRARPTGVTTRRRPVYSRLPYVAVAATNVMLVGTLWREGLTFRAWGMVCGAVAVVSLVMIRQNLAFGDYARLLQRLDANMLGLRRHEQRFRSLVQHAADLTLLLDAQGNVMYASPALHDLVGVDPGQVQGRPISGALPRDGTPLKQLITTVAADPDSSARRELPVQHLDGSQRWVEAVAINRLHDTRVAGVIVNIRDVTAARAREARLLHEATHDHLTGLPNRALLNERVQRFLHGPAEDTRHEAGVLMLDLDDFKMINDELGHHVGDQMLIVVAARLRGCVRPADTVARLGGDEFVVLLTDTTQAGAIATARRILDALSEPMTIHGHPLWAAASIGVAVGAMQQFDGLLRDADAAMYRAKRDAVGVHFHAADDAPATVQATTDPGH